MFAAVSVSASAIEIVNLVAYNTCYWLQRLMSSTVMMAIMYGISNKITQIIDERAVVRSSTCL